MPSSSQTLQVEECLRYISEADQCLEQIATAQTKLRQALQVLCTAPCEGILSKGRVPTACGEDTLQDLGMILLDEVPSNHVAPGEDNSQEDKLTSLEEVPSKGRVTIAVGEGISQDCEQSTWKRELTKSHSKICDVLLDGYAEDAANQLGIPKEEVIKCYRMFGALDPNDSGKIDVLEMRDSIARLIGKDPGDPQWQIILEDLMLKHDMSSDGQMDFEEILFLYSNTPGNKHAHLAARVHYAEDRLNSKFRANVVGVRSDSVMDYCERKLNEERAFRAIPSIFLLLVAFILSVSSHRHNSALGATEHAFRFDIQENANFAFSEAIPFDNGRKGHKSIDDVNSIADFWSWLDLGIIPLIFPESWPVSEVPSNIGACCTTYFDAMSSSGWVFNVSTESTTTISCGLNSDIKSLCSEVMANLTTSEKFSGKPSYLFYNNIVGGVRLRQEQDSQSSCPNTDLFAHVYDNACVKTHDNWLRPDYSSALDIDQDLVNLPGAETQFFLSQTPQSEIRKQLRLMENRAWLNQQSRRWEVLYTAYNANINMFVAVYIEFFLNDAGHIHKIIKPVGTWVNPYNSVFQYIFDLLWMLLVLKLVCDESRMLFRQMKTLGCVPGFKFHFSDFGVAVNWASIIHSIAVLGMWLAYLSLVLQLQGYLMRARVDTHGSWSSSEERNDFFDLVDTMTFRTQRLRACLAFYPFSIGCRFFSAFAGQPRLAVVTDTMKEAWNDLLHFGVVLSAILACYGVSAEILFGGEVWEFENLGRSFVTVIRILLGDFDYVSLSVVGRPYAMVWFISFMIILNSVMLNMLLAIIMDVYSKVKFCMADDAHTFLSQCYETYQRWRDKRKGLRISLELILLSLERQVAKVVINGKPALITVSAFMDLVEGLSAEQAQQVLTHSEAKEISDSRNSGSMESALRFLDLRVQHLQHTILTLEGNRGQTCTTSL